MSLLTSFSRRQQRLASRENNGPMGSNLESPCVGVGKWFAILCLRCEKEPEYAYRPSLFKLMLCIYLLNKSSRFVHLKRRRRSSSSATSVELSRDICRKGDWLAGWLATWGIRRESNKTVEDGEEEEAEELLISMSGRVSVIIMRFLISRRVHVNFKLINIPTSGGIHSPGSVLPCTLSHTIY